MIYDVQQWWIDCLMDCFSVLKTIHDNSNGIIKDDIDFDLWRWWSDNVHPNE